MLRDRVILRYSLHRSVDQNIFYNYSNPRKTYKSHIRLKKWSIDFLSVLGVLQVISLKMSNECPPSKMALQSMVLEMKIDSTTGQRRDILRHCIGFLKGCKKVKLSRKSHSAVRKMILEILLGSQTSRPKHFVSPEKICALDIIGIQIIGQCCCAAMWLPVLWIMRLAPHTPNEGATLSEMRTHLDILCSACFQVFEAGGRALRFRRWESHWYRPSKPYQAVTDGPRVGSLW